MSKFIKTIYLLISVFLLTGCEETTRAFYSFGPNNSCYVQKNVDTCSSYKPYDTVNISINKQNNEVTYQLVGVGLDDSNTVIEKLTDCNIVDVKNFSCKDLISTDGKITNGKVLGNRVFSSVWWFSKPLFWVGKISIKKSTIQFVENNEWVSDGVILFFILMFIGLMG